METLANHKDDEINLLDTFSSLLAKWKLLAVITLVCSIAAFGASKMARKTYESTATIYAQSDSGISSLLRDIPFPINTGSGNSPDYFITLLNSETLMRRTIARLKLTNTMILPVSTNPQACVKPSSA